MEEERSINVDTGAGGLDNLPFKATISRGAPDLGFSGRDGALSGPPPKGTERA